MTKPPPKPSPAPRSGIAASPATTLFRVTNFELYARPNKFIMIVGATAFVSCCVYLYEWRKYTPIKTGTETSTDGTYTYSKKSKWDS